MPHKSHHQVRRAGVLLHISSLPTGDFGAGAYQFIDFLTEAGMSVWQTLPLNMPHDDGSPYQCLSAHAGNPAFISLESLVREHLLTENDLVEPQVNRYAVLRKAYIHYKQNKNLTLQKEFISFCHQNVAWLGDFALFLVLREKYHHASWNTWPKAYKNKQPAAIKKVKQRYAFEIGVIKFTQFLFFKQWHSLKQYANKNSIEMFGDIPIFVAYDSADVWAKPHLFKLNANKNMQVVAGVPPDYFSATGQRWGNPHYNWQVMQADGFKWWLKRISTQYRMFDMIRIDHFRGLQAAWEIPADEPTAINGQWALAPGEALLKVITRRFPNMQLIAEDLGVITDEVNVLRDQFQLPGMKILHFAFGGTEDNPYLPHNIEGNCVVYTGTHDNDTTLGWYQKLEEAIKSQLHALLDASEPNMPLALIELVFGTKANIAIVPMQDILGLDAVHRMNTPGTIDGNWQWRFDWEQLKKENIDNIKHAIKKSQRLNKRKDDSWH